MAIDGALEPEPLLFEEPLLPFDEPLLVWPAP